jgi:uncharacterized protein (DUF1778 family)
MGKQQSRGRPPVSPDDEKSKLTAFRATEAERAQFERAAQVEGVNLSDWIRSTLTRAARRVLRQNGE